MANVDLSKPSKRLVLDLINYDNRAYGANLTGAQIDIINLTPLEGEWNTAADAIGRPGSIFEGQVVAIEYDRLDLGIAIKSPAIILEGDFWNIATTVPLINSKYNLGLAPEELTPAGLDWENVLSFNVSESLAYLPNTGVTIKNGFFDWVDRLYIFTTVDFPDIVNS